IAAGLGEPLAMGELDRLQLLLAETRKADSDVQYLVLVNAEGKAVASTDLALKNQLLTRNEFERDMGRVSAFARRIVPDASDLFEVATPVRFQGAANGVLRMGVSTSAVSRIAARLALTIAIVGLVTLALGASIYLGAALRIVRPLRQAAGVLAAVAEGD